MICFRHSLVFFTLFLGGTNAYGEKASQLSQEDLTFFEIKIRPILATHCYECHSNSAEEVGGKLLLDSRDGSLAGGESGSIFDFDTPENSLIVQAFRHDGPQMPPEAPLPDTVVAKLRHLFRNASEVTGQ